MRLSDERLQILQMIAQGKISPEEGSDLLRAIDQKQETQGSARWLLVRVFEGDSVHPKTNVRLPLKMASKLLKFADRFAPGIDIDLEEVSIAISSGEPGKLVEVDADDGTRVEIYLEV